MRLSDATLALDGLMAAYFFTDTAYQYTWSKIEVHQTLLKDEVRMRAFEAAIRESVKPGDRVLDVGTGTGILAMLAAKAGAGSVIGVEPAEIIEVARSVAKNNGLSNVEFVRADIRDLKMPPVDCIICELIGMRLTDEGLTYKVANARRLLKPGGRIMPERIDVYLVPVESKDVGLGFFGSIHGIDYSSVGRFPKEVRNCDMGRCRYLAKPVKVFTIDLENGIQHSVLSSQSSVFSFGREQRTANRKPETVNREPETENRKLDYSGEFVMESEGEFHGFVMYWEARLSENVTLSTDPKKPLTHWKHMFLQSGGRTAVEKGDTLKVHLKAVLKDTQWRWEYLLDKS
ncbi:MAG: class I SAM-dependent methyltransferase [Candidatus Altiarchaeota archaeon]